MKVETAGKVREVIWDGWQSIEEYKDGQLTNRRTYGLGLDEIVWMDNDLDGDGTLESFVPLYDATGNVAVVTDLEGVPLERYDTDAFGGVIILADTVPPVVEQLRLKGGAILVEMSEEVLESQLTEAIDNGDLTLHNVTDDEAMPITVAQPVQRGKQARRRLMITTTDPPADGDEVRFTLEPAAAVDLFHNRLAATFTHTFSWSAADSLLLDEAAPEVSLVIVRDGIVEIELSEEIDPSTAASILIDGAVTIWSPGTDPYTLVAESALDAGSHQLTIDTQPLDLGGRGLDEAFSLTFAVYTDLPQAIAYDKPDSRETPDTTVGNSFGFHGLQKDAETGLIYVRNRYYDTELGRFITADPMGYVDGASMYQFAGYNPFNSGDPLGLREGDWWDPKSYSSAWGRTGRELWNVASLGTLSRVRNQDNRGTWLGLFESAFNGVRSISNTASLGLQDSIYETQMEEGPGTRSIGKGAEKAVVALFPVEEGVEIAVNWDRLPPEEKARVGSTLVSKTAGVAALGAAGVRYAGARQIRPARQQPIGGDGRVLQAGEGATAAEIEASTGGPTGGVRGRAQRLARDRELAAAEAAHTGPEPVRYTCWRCGQTSTNPDNMHLGHRNRHASESGNLEPVNTCLEGAACNLGTNNRAGPNPGRSCAERGGCGASYDRFD
ncbi:MAG: RHS repeat-associated core domain-containing protein [bacterium]|nr:RHS repeat-associated core domain-containing protein [bacterium]